MGRKRREKKRQSEEDQTQEYTSFHHPTAASRLADANNPYLLATPNDQYSSSHREHRSSHNHVNRATLREVFMLQNYQFILPPLEYFYLKERGNGNKKEEEGSAEKDHFYIPVAGAEKRSEGPRAALESAFTSFDTMVKWEHVEAVVVRADFQDFNCPICLEVPLAPHITRCGHVFCYGCITHSLHVQSPLPTWVGTYNNNNGTTSNSSGNSKRQLRECPVCKASITAAMLRPCLIEPIVSDTTALSNGTRFYCYPTAHAVSLPGTPGLGPQQQASHNGTSPIPAIPPLPPQAIVSSPKTPPAVNTVTTATPPVFPDEPPPVCPVVAAAVIAGPPLADQPPLGNFRLMCRPSRQCSIALEGEALWRFLSTHPKDSCVTASGAPTQGLLRSAFLHPHNKTSRYVFFQSFADLMHLLEQQYTDTLRRVEEGYTTMVRPLAPGEQYEIDALLTTLELLKQNIERVQNMERGVQQGIIVNPTHNTTSILAKKVPSQRPKDTTIKSPSGSRDQIQDDGDLQKDNSSNRASTTSSPQKDEATLYAKLQQAVWFYQSVDNPVLYLDALNTTLLMTGYSREYVRFHEAHPTPSLCSNSNNSSSNDTKHENTGLPPWRLHNVPMLSVTFCTQGKESQRKKITEHLPLHTQYRIAYGDLLGGATNKHNKVALVSLPPEVLREFQLALDNKFATIKTGYAAQQAKKRRQWEEEFYGKRHKHQHNRSSGGSYTPSSTTASISAALSSSAARKGKGASPLPSPSLPPASPQQNNGEKTTSHLLYDGLELTEEEMQWLQEDIAAAASAGAECIVGQHEDVLPFSPGDLPALPPAATSTTSKTATKAKNGNVSNSYTAAAAAVVSTSLQAPDGTTQSTPWGKMNISNNKNNNESAPSIAQLDDLTESERQWLQEEAAAAAKKTQQSVAWGPGAGTHVSTAPNNTWSNKARKLVIVTTTDTKK